MTSGAAPAATFRARTAGAVTREPIEEPPCRPAPQWLPADLLRIPITFGPMSGDTCESCGRDDDDLVRVRRVYVTPEAWDTEGRTEVQAEIEAWCFSCRTHYPHQEV